jgi:hypothetical protein
MLLGRRPSMTLTRIRDQGSLNGFEAQGGDRGLGIASVIVDSANASFVVRLLCTNAFKCTL